MNRAWPALRRLGQAQRRPTPCSTNDASCELAQFVQVHVAEQAHGAVKLTVGGRTLLEGDAAQQLKLAKDADGKLVLDLNAAAIADDLVGGALGGELKAHNRDLPQYQQQLDDFAFNVITQMNGLHSVGYDAQGNPGGDFYRDIGGRH